MSAWTRDCGDSSSSFSKRLKSGAITLGTTTWATIAIASHAAHAQSHQALPAAAMIQSTPASSGTPTTTARAMPLSVSAS